MTTIRFKLVAHNVISRIYKPIGIFQVSENYVRNPPIAFKAM